MSAKPKTNPAAIRQHAVQLVKNTPKSPVFNASVKLTSMKEAAGVAVALKAELQAKNELANLAERAVKAEVKRINTSLGVITNATKHSHLSPTEITKASVGQYIPGCDVPASKTPTIKPVNFQNLTPTENHWRAVFHHNAQPTAEISKAKGSPPKAPAVKTPDVKVSNPKVPVVGSLNPKFAETKVVKVAPAPPAPAPQTITLADGMIFTEFPLSQLKSDMDGKISGLSIRIIEDLYNGSQPVTAKSLCDMLSPSASKFPCTGTSRVTRFEVLEVGVGAYILQAKLSGMLTACMGIKVFDGRIYYVQRNFEREHYGVEVRNKIKKVLYYSDFVCPSKPSEQLDFTVQDHHVKVTVGTQHWTSKGPRTIFHMDKYSNGGIKDRLQVKAARAKFLAQILRASSSSAQRAVV